MDGTYVFIDESGDSGFKLTQGSSPIFCLAAVLFDRKEDIDATQKVIGQLRADLHRRLDHEFHFNRESDRFRWAFCEAVRSCPFRARAIVIDKEVIYEDSHLRHSPKHFYNYAAKALLKHSFGSITNAKVRIDGSMNRELKTYLQKELNTETRLIREIKFSDSRRDSIIQLADMVAGSISRTYRPGRKDPEEFRQLLKPRIEDVWEFGRAKKRG